MKNIVFFLLASSQFLTATMNFNEQKSLKNLENAVSLSGKIFEYLSAMCQTKNPKKISFSDNNFLFQHYPILKEKIPYISLGTFPTPVQHLKNLGKSYNCQNLYIKRDDLSGKICSDGTQLFGGNKVRKLEHLLGDAIACGCDSVITWGVVGSYHAVATACYANFLGLRSITMVKPEPNSHNVRKNLKLLHHFNSEIIPCPNNTLREVQTIATFVEQKYRHDSFPYFIPTGGSIPLGITGFVNAAFELKHQITKGILPEPDKIYIPAGSWGSVVGLLIGKKACNLKTKIMIIAVEPEEYQYEHKNYLLSLFEKTNEYLHDLDATFPILPLNEQDFEINHMFTGPEYGRYTMEGHEAKHSLQETENINLDGTYSAKAMAAMMYDLSCKKNNNEVVLFWLTYCSAPFKEIVENHDFHDLPQCLHHYYKEPVQEFDR